MMHPLIRQIVDRDCHVSMSYRDAIEHVVSKLRRGRETFRAMPRADRRALIADCVAAHRENRDLYAFVMNGCIEPRKED